MSIFSNLQPSRGIYLDYSATTPVSKRVMDKIQPYFSDNFANPSSMHIMGQNAQGAIDEARQDVADILGCSWKEIYFLPSATESINLALRGTVKSSIGRSGLPTGVRPSDSTAKKEGLTPEESLKKLHIITTNIEHSAVLNTCDDLQKQGIEVTYLRVNKEGLIKPQQVKNALQKNTVLVSIGYVNNEIGTIQPIKEIAQVISDYKLQTKKHRPYFHIDAVQAVNYLDVGVEKLGVDLMTLSGHKIYGPKGTGLLFKKENVNIFSITTGGKQERGLHGGTENVPSIVGFAEALKETQELKELEKEKLEKLRNNLIDRVLSSTKNITLNGTHKKRIANNISFCFKNKESEVLIPLFDSSGIYISGGSACTSRTIEPSRVIMAIGKEACAKNSIRITLGRLTTEKDIEKVINVILNIV